MSQRQSIVVPQIDLKASYLAHKIEIDAAVHRVLESGWYILGSEVKAFEDAFSVYVGVRNAIGVASGTDALVLALRAVGAGPGDLVFTVSHTAVATVAAIELAGATPVLVDIDPTTYTMDVNSLATVLACPPKGRAKAIVPVHLYGQPADMPAIIELAQRHGLYVIEDCAQAHGAMLTGRMVGSWGNIAAFSFYPTKALGALGDAGMVLTDNKDLAERVRLLQQYGWRERFISHIQGDNSRLDEIQAAVLRVKLNYLEQEIQRRNELAMLYNELLKDTSLLLPSARINSRHVYHQYVVRSPQRDKLAELLKQKGIGTNIHYPVPVHLQPAYLNRLPKAIDLSHTEKIVKEILSVPMYPQLTEEHIHRICKIIRRWAEHKDES